MIRTTIAMSLLGAGALASGSVFAQGMPSGPETTGPVGATIPTAAGPNWTPTAEGAIVRQQVHDAGYSGVTMLLRNPDGSWQGQALKGETFVMITVDPAGHVAQR
jgi:ABC-type sugar transport system substrate-binding protein